MTQYGRELGKFADAPLSIYTLALLPNVFLTDFVGSDESKGHGGSERTSSSRVGARENAPRRISNGIETLNGLIILIQDARAGVNAQAAFSSKVSKFDTNCVERRFVDRS